MTVLVYLGIVGFWSAVAWWLVRSDRRPPPVDYVTQRWVREHWSDDGKR